MFVLLKALARVQVPPTCGRSVSTRAETASTAAFAVPSSNTISSTTALSGCSSSRKILCQPQPLIGVKSSSMRGQAEALTHAAHFRNDSACAV